MEAWWRMTRACLRRYPERCTRRGSDGPACGGTGPEYCWRTPRPRKPAPPHRRPLSSAPTPPPPIRPLVLLTIRFPPPSRRQSARQPPSAQPRFSRALHAPEVGPGNWHDPSICRSTPPKFSTESIRAHNRVSAGKTNTRTLGTNNSRVQPLCQFPAKASRDRPSRSTCRR